MWVGKKRSKEVLEPDASDCDRGVVAVRGHVGGYEHPLRELVGGEVRGKQSCVFYFGKAISGVGYGTVENFWAKETSVYSYVMHMVWNNLTCVCEHSHWLHFVGLPTRILQNLYKAYLLGT